MVKRPMIVCECCKGAGEVPLSDILNDTLYLVRVFGPITAETVMIHSRETKTGITAFNGRLEKLRRLELVTREKDGREWFYSITAKGKGRA